MNIELAKKTINELSKMIQNIHKVNLLMQDYCCVDGTIIGTGRSDYTTDSTTYNLSIKDKNFALIDIPGIEGDESAFEAIIKQSLEKAHIIFYVNGSGKKIESETLQKIKKYMRDGTSVYALFNVHCKPKNERILGIDKEYRKELEETYIKQNKIIEQTEKELVPFLGDNYKGYVCLNGLLGFSALAFSCGNRTSIKNEQDKNLRKNQIKYLKEYNDNKDCMFDDSHIPLLVNVIEKKIDSFDSDIMQENIKKLRNRMSEMILKISNLKKEETKKLNGFINAYNEFTDRCCDAKNDFIRIMKHVASNTVSNAFYELMNEIFDKIECDQGKTKPSEIQDIADKRKNSIVEKIQQGINERIDKATKTFIETIKDAQERLKKDFERGQLQFDILLLLENIKIDEGFADALKYNSKDFMNYTSKVVGLGLTGAIIGSSIPGLGTAIGAAIGAALGALSSLWNYFASKQERINNAKAKIREIIDEQIEEATKQINEELNAMSYEQKISECYNSLCIDIETQKKKISDVKIIINNVESEMMEVYSII